VAGCLLALSTAGAIIQLDRGIAGARLGSTKVEVKTVLGEPNRAATANGHDLRATVPVVIG
jgi:hypothetical protein